MSKGQSLVEFKEKKSIVPYSSGPRFSFSAHSADPGQLDYKLRKFEDDFNTLYKKITDVFYKFDPKKNTPSTVSVYRYLANQLIWTFKYLVEMAALEDNEKWLRRNFPIFDSSKFSKIMPNIIALNPKLWKSIKHTLDKAENLLKGESYGSIAWRWTENIVDLGTGVVTRDILKNMRIKDAKKRLEASYERISTHNDAAIINVENYEKYVREKTFRRKTKPIIEAHNRQKRLAIIEKQLKKDPENGDLQGQRQKLLEKEMKYQEQEAQTKIVLKEEKYEELVRERGYKIEKVNAKIGLGALARKYKQVALHLGIEDTDSHANLCFRIDLLHTMLSKTCGNDKVYLDYRHFMTLLSAVRKEMDNLYSIRTLISVGEISSTEDKLFMPIPSNPSDFRLTQKFAEADFKKKSVVKQMQHQYFHIKSILNDSIAPGKEVIIKENQRWYEKFIDKAAQFFLSLPPEEQRVQLFEIDEKTNLTASLITKKYHQLSLIFHTDKLDIPANKLLMFRINEIRQEFEDRLIEENNKKISKPMEKVVEKIAGNLLVIQEWFESLLNVNTPQFRYYIARNIYRFNTDSGRENKKSISPTLTPALTYKK